MSVKEQLETNSPCLTRRKRWGTDMRRGLCSKLNTDSGGVSSRGTRCVCVCRPEHEPVWPFDLKWHLQNPLEKNYNLFHDLLLPRSIQTFYVFLHYGLWPLTPGLTVSAPSHTNTLPTRTIPGTLIPTWTPHFKAFIYLVYHQRIWGIWWTISLLHPSVDEEKSLNRLIENRKQKKNEKRDKSKTLEGNLRLRIQKSPSSLLPSSFLSII